MNIANAAQPKSRRRRNHFSLRTLLIGVTMAGLCFAYAMQGPRWALASNPEPIADSGPSPIVRVEEKPVSLHAKDRPLKEIAKSLESQCSRRLAINWIGFPPEPKVSVDLKNVPFLQAIAELSLASKTPIDPIGGAIGLDDRQEITFWRHGFLCDHYLATGAMLILERYEQETAGNEERRYVVLDNYHYDYELTKVRSFDVYFKDSKSGRVVPVSRSAGKGGGWTQWYQIPSSEVGHVDTVGGKLDVKVVSPLLKTKLSLKTGARAKGEGFEATVLKADQGDDPSAEVLIVRDDGRRDFTITDAWLVDSKGATVQVGRRTFTYDSKLKTRAEVWAKDLARATKIGVTFGLRKDVEASFEFPLPKK